jgi:hypothetical protein
MAALVAYLICYTLGFMVTPICLISQLLGVLRKAGVPRFDIMYAQGLIFTEEFQTLTYVMSISMSKGGLFLNMPIIIATLLTLSVDFKKELDTRPTLPIVSMPQVKQYVLKGAQTEN